MGGEQLACLKFVGTHILGIDFQCNGAWDAHKEGSREW